MAPHSSCSSRTLPQQRENKPSSRIDLYFAGSACLITPEPTSDSDILQSPQHFRCPTGTIVLRLTKDESQNLHRIQDRGRCRSLRPGWDIPVLNIQSSGHRHAEACIRPSQQQTSGGPYCLRRIP